MQNIAPIAPEYQKTAILKGWRLGLHCPRTAPELPKLPQKLLILYNFTFYCCLLLCTSLYLPSFLHIRLLQMDNKKQQRISLARLSKHYGYNRKSIADALGVELITVYSWFNRGRISKEAAIRVEVCTKGEITAAQLRPDVPDFFEG